MLKRSEEQRNLPWLKIKLPKDSQISYIFYNEQDDPKSPTPITKETNTSIQQKQSNPKRISVTSDNDDNKSCISSNSIFLNKVHELEKRINVHKKVGNMSKVVTYKKKQDDGYYNGNDSFIDDNILEDDYGKD